MTIEPMAVSLVMINPSKCTEVSREMPLLEMITQKVRNGLMVTLQHSMRLDLGMA